MVLDAINQLTEVGDFVTVKLRGRFRLAIVTALHNPIPEPAQALMSISTARIVLNNSSEDRQFFSHYRRQFNSHEFVRLQNPEIYRSADIEETHVYRLNGELAMLKQIQIEMYEQLIANLGNPKFVMPKRFV
jgi:hypothetical protein